jgi:hypothetical protein
VRSRLMLMLPARFYPALPPPCQIGCTGVVPHHDEGHHRAEQGGGRGDLSDADGMAFAAHEQRELVRNTRQSSSFLRLILAMGWSRTGA